MKIIIEPIRIHYTALTGIILPKKVVNAYKSSYSPITYCQRTINEYYHKAHFKGLDQKYLQL